MTETRVDTDKTYLVNGAAGFIGYHLAKRLLAEDCRVDWTALQSDAIGTVPVASCIIMR